MIDWSRYAVGGAAARPDSFTKLNPDYAARVAAMLAAADNELGPRALTITSAYRSPEVQARLFADAVRKYGSEAAARKWVAPPGRSQHNRGLAVDFANSAGSLLRDPNSREARWIAANAERFGLAVPMSWEPWQVELPGARGAQGTGSRVAAPAPQPVNVMADMGQPPAQEPQSPENILAAMGWRNPVNDPAAFQMRGNALAMQPIVAERRNYLSRRA